MLKRLVVGTILAFLGFFTGFSDVFAFTEKIDNFSVEISISDKGIISVVESISYDFGTNNKHGIHRDIPIEKGTKFKVLSVKDEFGNDYTYKVSVLNNYWIIKVGDPDKLITGKHVYNIFYQVKGVIDFFDDHDELYWNVTGNEWEVPIEKSEVKIIVPNGISSDDLQTACFTGVYGSKESVCNIQTFAGGAGFAAEKSFLPNEGLTVVIGCPKGFIKPPSFLEKARDWMEMFWPVIIPVFVFFYLLKKWLKEGKDFPLKGPIVAQYDTVDNLKPAEVGAIMRQAIKREDISATIIDFAVRGYLRIEEIGRNGLYHRLVKLKDFEKDGSYEYEIFKKIFGSADDVKVSDLREKFSVYFHNIKEKILNNLVSRKYFDKNPNSVFGLYFIEGLLISIFGSFASGFLVIFLSSVAHLSFSALLVPAIFTSGILFIIFSPFMPQRTEKGADAYWYLLGFKEYMNTAEKYRLQFQEKENIFERFLPYAIVFGCVDKWTKAFEGIYKEPPSWYEAKNPSRFSPAVLGGMIGKLNTVGLAPVRSGHNHGSGFGGGGHSGGGHGGGGGGSW